jgi:hypothetical protein
LRVIFNKKHCTLAALRNQSTFSIPPVGARCRQNVKSFPLSIAPRSVIDHGKQILRPNVNNANRMVVSPKPASPRVVSSISGNESFVAVSGFVMSLVGVVGLSEEDMTE